MKFYFGSSQTKSAPTSLFYGETCHLTYFMKINISEGSFWLSCQSCWLDMEIENSG